MTTTDAAEPSTKPQVVVLGGGFAGFYALRRLRRRLGDRVRLVLVTPTDYLLYSPLLPEVATGATDPRSIAVPFRQALPTVRMLVGHVTAADLPGRTLTLNCREGPVLLSWDRLVLAPGSVTRQFSIPGLAEHAHGLKTLAEALYVRNHLLAQLDRADALSGIPEAAAERRARLTVVAVGAGYTGTELVAQLQHWLSGVAERWTRLDPTEISWILVDLAPQVLPELGPRLGAYALEQLRRRGIDVRLGVTVSRVGAETVSLSDGSEVAAKTLLWSAGVTPSPLISRLGLPTVRGRLATRSDLSVPGAHDVWALGDAAAVPDLTRAAPPGSTARPLIPPTAQHAQRQGTRVADNVAATLGAGRTRPYVHHDLGLVADLGGWEAVAKPLGVPLTGVLAKAVTKGYHLFALPTLPAKIRVGADWLLAATLPARVVQLNDVADADALISAAQFTQIYPEVSSPAVAPTSVEP